MILSNLSSWPSTHVDVCIIGAGAAGITLACELDGCGKNVLLLEAGGYTHDRSLCSDLFGGVATGGHLPTVEFRRACFGGTTAIWGGRCVPYDPIDFVPRAHVPNSGWPIEYEDVAAFYPRALIYCDAGRCDFSPASMASRPSTSPAASSDQQTLIERIERYSLPTHFGKAYRHQLTRSANVTVALRVRCLRLHRGEDGRVAHAEVVGPAGRKQQIHADTFVLANGALEATRLLWVSDPDGPGLGNAGGCLGRYYQCHFANVCAEAGTRGDSLPFGFEKTHDGIYARRKWHLSEHEQRRHRLLNTTFRLHFPDYADASHRSSVLSAIYLLKSTLIPEYKHIVQHGLQQRVMSPASSHLRNAARDLPGLVRFGGDWARHRVVARRKLPYTLVARADGTFPVEFNSEQTPSAASRVSLSAERDAHGLPRLQVDWRLAEDDVDAGVRAFHVLRRALRSGGRCDLHFDDEQLRESLSRSIPIGGHHIGTARMASSVRGGVVDRNCAVHGTANLYVAGSAVFPTSSHANPTLTIVAMALRLARHLRTSAR